MTNNPDSVGELHIALGMAKNKEDEQANAVYEAHQAYSAAKLLFEQYRDERRSIEAKLAAKKRRAKKPDQPALDQPSTGDDLEIPALLRRQK